MATPQPLVNFVTYNIIVLNGKNFHDEWYKIATTIQAEVTTYYLLAPFQPNKAIMRYGDHKQVKSHWIL